MGGIEPIMFRLAGYALAQEPPAEENDNSNPLLFLGLDGFEFESWKHPPSKAPKQLTPLERKARCLKAKGKLPFAKGLTTGSGIGLFGSIMSNKSNGWEGNTVMGILATGLAFIGGVVSWIIAQNDIRAPLKT